MRPESSSFQVAPSTGFHVFDVVRGVKARWLDDLRLRISRRQVIRPEDEGLDAVVPAGNGAQHGLQLRVFGDVAAAEQREGAEA